MKASIIVIGNSQGVRIPKALLEESGLSGEVEMELTKEGLLISRAKRSRSGWRDLFKDAPETDDDESGDILNQTDFDKKDWKW